MKNFLLLLAVFWPGVHLLAQRQSIVLADGWKFLRQDAVVEAPVNDAWKTVGVPHCWNALDGQNGKAADPDQPGGYYRGPAWYARALDVPTEWRGRRVFIRFGAAFLVADVYLNGKHLGQHRGGFAAFCYELTADLEFGERNEVRVRLDNSHNVDVPPLSADFTMEGGLYRPVSLLVTDQTCITPLDFGGPGTYATPSKVSTEAAEIEIATKLAGPAQPDWQVVTEIRDARGKPVLQQMSPAVGPEVRQVFHLPHPHLWNGHIDPYLYTFNVQLRHGAQVVDEVTQSLGLRTVEISSEKGFLLNGQPYPVHGVCRHQEKLDKGWALTPADEEEDFQIIGEMGANAIRLAHYQQSENVHDLADRAGILLWQEIPLVDEITDSLAFTDNVRQQLTEMIRQGYNHPAIFTWGLFNEMYQRPTPPPEALIASLEKLAREFDPTRLTTGASNTTKKPDLVRITPLMGFNQYPGWYGASTEDLDQRITVAREAIGGGRRIAITEYGAGANPAQHQEGAPSRPVHNGLFHPEEYQAFVHERVWAQMREHPGLWGTFVWAMFDFAADDRNQGSTPGRNDKGLVTEDRKLRKDAFFFYKANWNPEPMVYVAARRMTPRKQAVTEVKAYSNCAQVELKLNGQNVGLVKPDETHVCRWHDVALKPGSNQVEVSGLAPSGQMISDQCQWELATP